MTTHVTFDANNSGYGTWLQVTPIGVVRLGERWSVEARFPFYYVNPGSTEEGTSAETGIGDLALSVWCDLSSQSTTLYAIGTAGLPTGRAEDGLGAGSTSWDASGYLERAFGRLTPSLDAGVGSNTALAETAGPGRLSTGARAQLHVNAWAGFEVWKSIDVSAGIYAIRPIGTGSAPLEAPPEEWEYDDFTRDEGFQLVGSAGLTPHLELSVWFTRSYAFAFNTYSVSLGVDLATFGRVSGAPVSPRGRRPR